MIDQGKMLKNLARAAKRSGGSRGGPDPGAAFRESFVEDRRRRRQAAEKLRRRREKEAVEFEGMSSELKRLAESGFAGPSQARAVYDRLMASDISVEQKRRLAEVMQGDRSHEDADADRGFLGRVKDVASAPISGGLKALATVGRVVPALVDEGMEALYDYDKEGMDTSFLDKVWRDDDYGFGKAFQRSVDFEKARGGDGKLFGLVDADNEALKRGVGLVGDIALDPLTYTTLGAGTALSAGGKAARAGAAAARVSRRADALKAAGKAGKAAELAGDAGDAARVLEKAGRFGSRRGPQLSKFQVGHRFAEHSKIAHEAARKAEKAGDAAEAAKHLAKAKEFEDAAAAVARRGAGGVSGSMLDEVGLQGGLNFLGRQLLSHDTVRPLTSKAGAVAGAGSRKLSPVLRNLGSDELKELRRVYREGVVKGADGKLAKASGRDIADAMLTRTATQMGGTPASRRLMATVVQPLEKLFKDEVDRRGISGEKLYHAITGNTKAAQEIELAAPGLLQKVRDGVAEVRRGVNEISGGADVIADRGESYLQGLVSDEYREFAQKMGWWDGQVSPTAKKGGKYRKSNEMRAHRAGDEFMGQQLGSPELHARFSPDYEPGSVGAIQRQMEGLAHDNGLPASVKMFEEDAFASVRSMVRSASVRAQELGTARHLMELGVASPMRGADVGEAVASAAARVGKVESKLGKLLGEDVAGLSGQRLSELVTSRMASATPAARKRVDGLVKRKAALDAEFATLSSAATLLSEGPEGLLRHAGAIREALGETEGQVRRALVRAGLSPDEAADAARAGIANLRAAGVRGEAEAGTSAAARRLKGAAEVDEAAAAKPKVKPEAEPQAPPSPESVGGGWGSVYSNDYLSPLAPKWTGPDALERAWAEVWRLEREVVRAVARGENTAFSEMMVRGARREAEALGPDPWTPELYAARVEGVVPEASGAAQAAVPEVSEAMRGAQAAAARADEASRDAYLRASRLEKAADWSDAMEAATPFLESQASKLEAAAQVSDPALRQVMVLDAVADGLEGALLSEGGPIKSADEFLRRLRASEKNLGAMLEDGFTAMGDLGLRHHELPDWVYEAIERTVDFSREPNKLLQQIDKVNTHFKAFALASVGFHVRNFFGGVFNNALDGVEMGAYRSARRVNRAWSTGDVSKLSPDERLFLREVERSGMLYDELKAGFEIPDSMRTRQMILEGDPNVAGRKKDRFMERQAVKVEGVRSEASRGRRAAADAVRAFGLTDNALTRANTEAGNYVERQLRLANYISNRSRGMTPDESMFKVYQFHFDYSDLSTAEMGWGRRLIPFWTWTSRNLPLQLEMMVKNPKMYNRFNHVKRALEGDEDGRAAFHPSWLTNNPSNINVSSLPFVGDKVDYFRPDLPFGDIDQQVQAISTHGFAGLTESASPVFRVPMELAFGVQSFNNAPISDKAEPIPSSWSWLSPALEALPSSFRRPDGRLMISGETRYVIEQFQPALARIKGLFPGDNEKDQARRTDRLLSFMGLGTTRVTDQMKSNEFYRVKDEFEALEDRAVKQGRAQSPEQRRAMKALEKLEEQAAKDRKKERDERLKRIQKVGGR